MRCPSCGNLNRAEARFCDSCGASLEAEPSPGTPGPDRPADGPAVIAGRYRVEAIVGRAPRKRVYRARDREDGDREVAVAVFDTEGVGETVLGASRAAMDLAGYADARAAAYLAPLARAALLGEL